MILAKSLVGAGWKILFQLFHSVFSPTFLCATKNEKRTWSKSVYHFICFNQRRIESKGSISLINSRANIIQEASNSKSAP